MTLGSVLRNIQVFIYAFSFAVLTCMGGAMMAGRLDSTDALGWMAENMIRDAMAGSPVRDRSFDGSKRPTLNEIKTLLGQDDRDLSSLDRLKLRRHAEIAASRIQIAQ